MATLLLPKGKHEAKSKPIPQYSMRGYIMRRKWKKANVNSSSFKMFQLFLMISILNTAHYCAAREIRTGHNGVSSHTFDNGGGNNATSTVSSNDNDGPHFTWIVQRKECDKLDNGCSCERKERNMTTIRCQCDNETQVAHIKSPGHDIRHSSSFIQKEKWIWKFEHCSKVVVRPESLITVGGSHFDVDFFNISGFTIHDSAFATRDTSHGSQNHVSLHFDHCKMDNLPTKTFSTFMNSIRFTSCSIKSISHRFIYSLRMGDVTFDSCKIDNIDNEAFYSSTIIDTLNVVDSTVWSISSNGVASAMNKMVWINSAVEILQEDALSGNVANVTLHNCKFAKVESSGFTVKTWNKVILTNNTFENVARRGIDLSHHAENDPSVEIVDNSWGNVERDFIATGSSDNAFVTVRYNTFSVECKCGNTLNSQLSTNGSRSWFHQELLANSRCPISAKALECLITNEYVNATDSNLLLLQSVQLLCETKIFMCTKDVTEVDSDSTTDGTVPGRPQLPNRLRVLAYFIAVMGIFIIVSLLITMCVFLCRRKIPRKKSPTESPLQSVESVQGKKTGMPKSLSGGEYADIVFKHNNGTSVSRPRSMLLEDVEMEDKGVQTMPTELSSEVLEGLREKLSRPDSFWDAKETIDHLYDLIQVKELNSGLSSPPDVTMCNGQSTTASTARLLPSTSSSPVAQITSAGVSVSIGSSDPQILQCSVSNSSNSSPVSDTPPPLPTTSPPKEVPLLQRYAHIRNKAKTAPLCEYSDPSDSSMHIYSELSPQPHPEGSSKSPGKSAQASTSHSSNGSNKNLASPSNLSQPNKESPSHKNSFLSANRRPAVHNGPILCEYTEPKDVQTHVYAELSNNPLPPKSSSPSKTGSPVKSLNSGTKPVGVSPSKQPISESHVNTITIAVPPPPISIPHSNSFHNSPRHLAKIKENDLSSSNPSIATSATTPVKIIHVNDVDSLAESKNPYHRRRWPSEKLRRSQSSADASGARSSTSVSSLLKIRESGSSSGSDTQKRPLPSIPSWSSKNEAKSQF